jgi:single-strand DNA-binding protein
MQYREYDDANGQKQKIAEVVLQRFRGALTLLDNRESGGASRGSFNEDFAGGDDFASGGSTRTQSRPQPAAFDTDLDDDVPF